MTIPFNTVQGGKELNLSASDWNRAMEAAKRVLGPNIKSAATSNPTPRSSHHTLQVQNKTDAAWPNRACVQVRDIVHPDSKYTGIAPYSDEWLGYFLTNPIYEGWKPQIHDQRDGLTNAASEQHANLFGDRNDYTRCGITLQPAAPDEVVPVLFSGITQVRVKWNAEEGDTLYRPPQQPYAGETTRREMFGLPVHDEVEYLQRAVGGICRIMMSHELDRDPQAWIVGHSGGPFKWCTVMVDQSDARMVPIIEFKLTEDFTVNSSYARAKVYRNWGQGVSFKYDKDIIIHNPRQHENESISSADEGEFMFRGKEGHHGIAVFDDFYGAYQGYAATDHFIMIMMECP